MAVPSNTAREVFKLLRGVGFTITADADNGVEVSAPDPAMLPILHTRYAGLVAKYSTEMRPHLEAVGRLVTQAKLAALSGDMAAAWNLWTAVRGFDPENDEAMEFFSRATALQPVVTKNSEVTREVVG
jgi:hypothetical protein